MKFFKKNLIVFTLLFLVSFFIVGTGMAANLTDWSSTLDDTAAADAAGYDTSTSVQNIVSKVISAVLSLLGVIFLILMIYGGFIWMMARGNESEVEKAQGIIRAAIFGLVIILAAYALTYFVVESLTSATLSGASE